jgi:hypothetical protein
VAVPALTVAVPPALSTVAVAVAVAAAHRVLALADMAATTKASVTEAVMVLAAVVMVLAAGAARSVFSTIRSR